MSIFSNLTLDNKSDILTEMPILFWKNLPILHAGNWQTYRLFI